MIWSPCPCNAPGRVRTLSPEGGQLVVGARPEAEKGETAHTQTRRRMREAEAVIALTETVDADLRALEAD